MMFHALRQARTAIADGIAATPRGGQPFGNLAAAEVVATVHHCVYCSTLWNACASMACAEWQDKRGTFRYSGSSNCCGVDTL